MDNEQLSIILVDLKRGRSTHYEMFKKSMTQPRLVH